MRDRRRVVHPAPPGRADAAGMPVRPRAVVVGGGIAGLTAATGLVERGVEVDLVEREPYLGGRVGGWSEHVDGVGTAAMNRGFHAFFRQYYNLRNLLRRIDGELSMLTPVADYPLIDAHGRRDTFRGLPQTPPFNAVAFALRSPTFRLRDLARINARAAAPLAAVSVPDIYDRLDGIDAATFLRDINFPEAARHLAFEVFSRSFFALPPELSAAELATMFHIYFLGSSEGLVFDVAADNFDVALWNPLRVHLEARGVRFHTGVRATAVEAGFTVHCDSGQTLAADGVVLATDVGGLQQIIDASPGLGDDAWRASVAGLGTAPPFLVQRLWLDRPVAADRPAFLGTGGLPPVDNVSVLERYESQAAQWAGRTGGSVVELHSYSVTDTSDDLPRRLLARLHEIFPETANARIVGQRLLMRQDCPRFAPGDFAHRPRVATPVDGLALAGDGIRIDLPVALMERAATTGWSAANRLLGHFGLAGHALTTVPTTGRSPALRRLAQRGA
ncbi:FAD-dependent oxidoreductase [Mycolicibacterium sp. S2-37]|uniref:FAD-dependent oxidoreductase n=1 Tax=Mycolicibacterium sp. S2-37 TaxID=2810297 RepID=UPI001A943ABD|nr:FAD-dependent oxidoreductase [Mycolicibacterium sp. S2-37]MBO0679843.1 FAD-dependent oxidoreductase [Mycolicibacterium sp. S2-37]